MQIFNPTSIPQSSFAKEMKVKKLLTLKASDDNVAWTLGLRAKPESLSASLNPKG